MASSAERAITVNLKQSGGVWDAAVEGRVLAIGMDTDPVKAALMAARRAGFKDAVYHSFKLDSAKLNQAVITLKIAGANPSFRQSTTNDRTNAMGCFPTGRMEELTAKIERGERLNNQERLDRQGIIFNHSGKCGKIIL